MVCFFLMGIGSAGGAQQSSGSTEVSGSFSFSQNSYGEGSVQWTRRWGLSVGYYFWEMTEIEVGVQDIFYRTKINFGDDTTFHDLIYSVDWVQSLTSRNARVQPYFKLGVGQLNRDASGTFASGSAPPAQYDALTVILGAGLRIFIVRDFALKGEFTTYLRGGVLSTWQDNLYFNGGFSIYF